MSRILTKNRYTKPELTDAQRKQGVKVCWHNIRNPEKGRASLTICGRKILPNDKVSHTCGNGTRCKTCKERTPKDWNKAVRRQKGKV
jgi:hypothetical protein